MRVLSDQLAVPEPIVEFRSHGATAVRLAHGAGEAHAYLLHFEAGGEIGRHETGFGQLSVVVAGEGWVSGDDGVRVEVSSATWSCSIAASGIPREPTPACRS